MTITAAALLATALLTMPTGEADDPLTDQFTVDGPTASMVKLDCDHQDRLNFNHARHQVFLPEDTEMTVLVGHAVIQGVQVVPDPNTTAVIKSGTWPATFCDKGSVGSLFADGQAYALEGVEHGRVFEPEVVDALIDRSSVVAAGAEVHAGPSELTPVVTTVGSETELASGPQIRGAGFDGGYWVPVQSDAGPGFVSTDAVPVLDTRNEAEYDDGPTTAEPPHSKPGVTDEPTEQTEQTATPPAQQSDEGGGFPWAATLLGGGGLVLMLAAFARVATRKNTTTNNDPKETE